MAVNAHPSTHPQTPEPTPPIGKAQEETQVFVASQWQLMWWRFRKHKLALFCAFVTLFIYFIAVVPDFFAPFPPSQTATDYTFAPPQRLHLFDTDESGATTFSPYVHDYTVEIDPVALRRTFVIDPEVKVPVGFFVEGEPYKVLGLFESTRRLIGPIDKDDPMYLFGADKLGRDLYSGIIYGTRISMSIGLVGVIFSLILGILLGGISGYYGGAADTIIQRIIEFLRSIPSIPLWLGLAAAMPPTWPPTYRYFAITIILLTGDKTVGNFVLARFGDGICRNRESINSKALFIDFVTRMSKRSRRAPGSGQEEASRRPRRQR